MSKSKYATGSNLPGFMPDPETIFHAASLEHAKAVLVESINNYIGCMHDYEEDASEAEKTLAEFEAAKPQLCNVYIGDFVFWIQEI